MEHLFKRDDFNTVKFLGEVSQNLKDKISGFTHANGWVHVYIKDELTSQEYTDLQQYIIDHDSSPVVHTTIITYLNKNVQPFIKQLMDDEAAVNIELGITQLGKTVDVLGMIVEPHLLPGKIKSISLKDTFDTGSLYASLEVLQHIRNNPSIYNGLSPFITDARLLSMKNKIETFLNVPLST